MTLIKDERRRHKRLKRRYQGHLEERIVLKSLQGLNDTGPKWFGMKAPILTPELETEVKLIKLQHVLDNNYKHHRDDGRIPKHFEVRMST